MFLNNKTIRIGVSTFLFSYSFIGNNNYIFHNQTAFLGILQVRAMLQILRQFGWTWIGLLVSDDDYGRHAARSFLQGLAHDRAGCPAYHEVLPGHSAPDEYRRIVSVVRASTARVVVVFSNQGYMLPLLDEVNITPCTFNECHEDVTVK